MYEIWKLYIENYSSYHVRTKVLTKFSCDLDLWIPKYIGIFLLPSRIYVRNMKAVRWKLLKLSCQNQSVDKVTLWPWPLDPKCIDIFLSPSCIYVWNMKTVRWKLLKLSCQNQSVDKFCNDLDLLTPKCISIFLSPSCIYVWNMKAVWWKLLKLLCQN